MKYVLQAFSYAALCVFIAMFTASPELRLLEDDEAMVSITFSHAAQRVSECVHLSQEELLKLPPNMRKPDSCPRGRHPSYVELLIDDELVYDIVARPTGLSSDGKSTVYQRVTVKAGHYTLTARMTDSGNTGTFDYENSEDVSIRPGQNLVVHFDESLQQFVFR
jgi:hypothetical protein